jgi:hypothetical protein
MSWRRLFVKTRQLDLKLRSKELMAVAPQKDKELSALDALADLLFRRRSLDRWLPHSWSHTQIAS